MTSLVQRPGKVGVRRGRRRWNLLDAVSASLAYLPIVLMGLLALGTYWLVRNTPVPEAPRSSTPPRGEPDYVMERFSVQRYAADGALRAQIAGDRLRHYPDTDTLLVDRPRIRTVDRDGRVTRAEADRAQSNGDASELLLEGSAVVVREPLGDELAIEVRGAEIRASRDNGRIVSLKPITVTRGPSVMRADALVYDHVNQVLTLTGRVRATLGVAGGGSIHVAPRTSDNASPHAASTTRAAGVAQ